MRFFISIADGLNYLRDLPPLFFRLILAYGFWGPFLMKFHHTDAFITFCRTLHYPFPVVCGYLALITEAAGIFSLVVGFATRLMSIPLILLLSVAILTVHLPNGFSAANNGFEIPLYYALMLFSLLATGPGRVSVDYLIARSYRARARSAL